MRTFSKSKLLALRQCPKRLWLEIHRPNLLQDSEATKRSFATGHSVGEIAQKLYDPDKSGAYIDIHTEGFNQAFTRTQSLLATKQPIFEAGFKAGGAMAFADVMLPTVSADGQLDWKMVEVKSSTSVKDYHEDDAAIQAYVARTSGVRLRSISLAHIDSSWVYPGDQMYHGLLIEQDLTDKAFARSSEVQSWIAQAQEINSQINEPAIEPGSQCFHPYECGFYTHCTKDKPQAEYPIEWLPRIPSKKVSALHAANITDLRDLPDAEINEIQQRVKHHTLSGMVYFNAKASASDLAAYPLPIQFLDFETIQFAIPIWAGTRPYQQIPFQFSLHNINPSGELSHTEFLDLSGNDPSELFLQALIEGCGGSDWPIFAYNSGFEKARITDLGIRFPRFKDELQNICSRIQDLLPIARRHYYHPSQKGSWSIKAVLPAAVPHLRYDELEGVQDGGMAMESFLEAIHPQTTAERRATIQQQLLAYCKLDTYAMVKLWQFFAGHTELDV